MHIEDTFHLSLPSHVAATSEEDRKAGEGCYVSTTIQNRRYYGVLVDQASLKAASLLYFQDEASGLDLNRKMEFLIQQQKQQRTSAVDDVVIANGDRPADVVPQPKNQNESQRIGLSADIADMTSADTVLVSQTSGIANQVQKFRYVSPVKNGRQSTQGYRLLLATYSDVTAAAEDNPQRSRLIYSACQSGGNFVGEYFYQFEVRCVLNHRPVVRTRKS